LPVRSSRAIPVYVALITLSQFCHLVRSKVVLGLVGVLMVVISLAMSVGVSALFGVHATLIISEVIPFLVLAIGTRN